MSDGLWNKKSHKFTFTLNRVELVEWPEVAPQPLESECHIVAESRRFNRTINGWISREQNIRTMKSIKMIGRVWIDWKMIGNWHKTTVHSSIHPFGAPNPSSFVCMVSNESVYVYENVYLLHWERSDRCHFKSCRLRYCQESVLISLSSSCCVLSVSNRPS